MDEAIDARVERFGGEFYHRAGTCAMGRVVDGECRVLGVVDATVIPLPIGARYQAMVYALVEKAADGM